MRVGLRTVEGVCSSIIDSIVMQTHEVANFMDRGRQAARRSYWAAVKDPAHAPRPDANGAERSDARTSSTLNPPAGCGGCAEP
jgi:hypothetical protein